MVNQILLEMLIRQIKNGNVEIKDVKKKEYKQAAIDYFDK